MIQTNDPDSTQQHGGASRCELTADSPKSMNPKAWKALEVAGGAPYAPDVAWSLPVLAQDGITWIAGEWMTPKYHDGMARLEKAGKVPMLYLSDDPVTWLGYDNERKRTIYEAEIGDAKSIAEWESAHSADFEAYRVRLLRPISQEELDDYKIRRSNRLRVSKPIQPID